MLLLLLSRFSRVQLCATPEMAAQQAPLSLGFSRQEHWSGLPFPSPMHESEVAQSCPTPSDPRDCSLPGSSVHGIFQARVLEWVAVAFFNVSVKNPFLDAWFIAVILESWKELLFLKYKMNLFEWLDLWPSSSLTLDRIWRNSWY